MARKTAKDPKEWLAYQHRMVALELPNAYMDEAMEALPEKGRNRIKNARSGMVMDFEVLEVLERISNREKGRRAASLAQVA